jgi:hypothetical protein
MYDSPAQPSPFASAIVHLAAIIQQDVHAQGALRRSCPGDPPLQVVTDLLHRAVFTHLEHADSRRWGVLAQAMALIGHAQDAHPGEQFVRAGVAPASVDTLLTADPASEPFAAALQRLCRSCAARRLPVDWVQLGTLVLAERHDALERSRARLARSYGRARASAA